MRCVSPAERQYSAKDYMGTLSKDWHPAGYSQVIGMMPHEMRLSSLFFPLPSISRKETIELPNFGARAFLIENLEISSIDHRIMCDFKFFETEQIPDIRGKSGNLPSLR
jgi:hypothetical protein